MKTGTTVFLVPLFRRPSLHCDVIYLPNELVRTITNSPARSNWNMFSFCATLAPGPSWHKAWYYDTVDSGSFTCYWEFKNCETLVWQCIQQLLIRIFRNWLLVCHRPPWTMRDPCLHFQDPGFHIILCSMVIPGKFWVSQQPKIPLTVVCRSFIRLLSNLDCSYLFIFCFKSQPQSCLRKQFPNSWELPICWRWGFAFSVRR